MEKTLVVTKADRKQAIWRIEMEYLTSVALRCPIFEAAKRAGLDPEYVGLEQLMPSDGTEWELDEAGRAITALKQSQWAKIKLPQTIVLYTEES